MRAAIYARRSTDHQEASIAVQIEEARRYIAERGWTVSESDIFIDDALSRAEYKKRPALYAMLNAAEKKERDFDVIVLRDVDRLGGDQNRNGVILSDLLDRGIRVDEYLTRNTVKLDSAIAKFMAAAKNFAAEIEREKTAQRTHEALKIKASKGLNVGGRCFGYDNHRVFEGEKHVRTEYKINDEQAAIVRWMYGVYVSGWGLKRIARDLNARGIASPQAGYRGTGSWSPNVIKPMLMRPRYRGVIKWGEFEKLYSLGTKIRARRAPDDPDRVNVEVPELRIVDDELWFAAQARTTKHGADTKRGRRPRYLLSGIGRCAECGGPIIVNNGKQGQEPIKVYTCGYHKQRGPEVCKNTLRRPLPIVEETVIGWLRQAMTPEMVLVLVANLRAEQQQEAKVGEKEIAALEREVAKTRKEIDRLVNALATMDDKPDAIVTSIAERQARVRELEAQVSAAKAAPQVVEDVLSKLTKSAYDAIHRFRETLDAHPQQAREAVASLFEKIIFKPVQKPEGPQYELEAVAEVGRFLALDDAKWASPAGVEPALAT